MKIDEQEFRSFIANLDKLFTSNYNEYFQSDVLFEYSQVIIKMNEYKKMLEAPKPSKWKQLKLPIK